MADENARVRAEPPFDDVLSAARVGAEWAWTQIYTEIAPKLVGYLRAHGAADPEDLAGEVLLQLVRGLPGFTGGEREFTAWTFTIAHRRLVDELRRRGRRPVEVHVDAAIDAHVGGDLEAEAQSRLQDASVRAAIDVLPTDQRAVILLRIIGDLTIEEIARALGKRPGAVKALQRRALVRLGQTYPFERPVR